MYYVCSCGHVEETDGYSWNEIKSCPKCGANLVDLSWNKIYESKLTIVKIEKSDIRDKSFDIIKVRYLTEIVNEKDVPVLKINNKEEWHTTFDFMNGGKLQIRKNGELLNNTESNIKKALSYTNLSKSDAENTL